MSSKRILIVEDNVINLKLTQVILTKENYDVLSASTAQEAWEMIHLQNPDLVLMDLQLPDMDGLELVRKLRKDPKTEHAIIIALTAYAMTKDKESAMQAGCNAYISKPFDVHHLLKTISEFLN